MGFEFLSIVSDKMIPMFAAGTKELKYSNIKLVAVKEV